MEAEARKEKELIGSPENEADYYKLAQNLDGSENFSRSLLEGWCCVMMLWKYKDIRQ